jgi:phage tail-like protein
MAWQDLVGGDTLGKIGGSASQVLDMKDGALANKLISGLPGPLKSVLGFVNEFIFGSRTDPNVQFRFYVEIGGISCLRFAECSGVEWKMEDVSFYEGGNYRNKVHLVGRGEFSPLILKKGFFAAKSEFYEWMVKIFSPDPSREVQKVTMALVILDEKGTDLGRFNFYNAFMTKYSGPAFNGKQSDIAFETVEIVYDYFDFKPTPFLSKMMDDVMKKGIGAVTGLLK